MEFLSVCFQSPCELYFKSIQIFIEICTKFECVKDHFSFSNLLLIPSCLINITIDILTRNVFSLEEITLREEKAILLTIVSLCLLREVEYSSLFFKQTFSSSEDSDSAWEESREMWFECQSNGG